MKLQKLSIPVKNPLVWLYVGGGLLLLGAVFLWCFKIGNDPQRVFWATIDRGLTTRGVTIAADQEEGDTTVKRLIRFSLGANNLSHSRTDFTQGSTRVVSETIGTPTVDYSQYVSIKTEEKKKDGTRINPAKVIGVWSKNDQGGQFFSQSVLGGSLPVGGLVVPIGKLSQKDRAEIVAQARKDGVYKTDFSKVKKERKSGRLLYTYEVSVQPVGYVALIKHFSQSAGLHALDQVVPADYKTQQAFKVKITVDVYARQVIEVAALDAKSRQKYLDYGLPVQVAVPTQTISSIEMQKRLADLQ